MATNTAHNLSEVVDAVTLVIDNPEASVDESCRCCRGQISTAGIIMGNEGIRKAYETGRGTFKSTSPYTIEEKRNGRMPL